ncbi:MAG: carboxymuconolactone decarboxylase family protein, partial [Mesorhizobium sp.]
MAIAGAFAVALASAPARADDYDATLKDIQSTMGGVPSFVK